VSAPQTELCRRCRQNSELPGLRTPNGASEALISRTEYHSFCCMRSEEIQIDNAQLRQL